MSRREVARLLVKVSGIAILAVALARLPGDIRAFGDHLDFLTIQGVFGDGEAIAIAASSSLLPFAIMLISGLGIVWISGHFMTAVRSDWIYFRRLETILVAVIGVYFLADGLSDSIRWLALMVSFIIAYDRPFTDLFSPHAGDFHVRGGVKLIVGFFVIIGRKGIVAARRRVDAWIRVWSCRPE